MPDTDLERSEHDVAAAVASACHTSSASSSLSSDSGSHESSSLPKPAQCTLYSVRPLRLR